jgi:hypothetical protein
LLSEAEWEYAARGGRKSRGHKFSGSDDPDSIAWFDENSGAASTNLSEMAWSGERKSVSDERKPVPHEVGMKMPNELGLYDMSGNVWEWCSDRLNAYADSEQTNPHNISGLDRAIRGGCWFKPAELTRIAHRGSLSPIEIRNGEGFRICRASYREAKADSFSKTHERQDDASPDIPVGRIPDLVLVERGSFKMGDTWGDGLMDEKTGSRSHIHTRLSDRQIRSQVFRIRCLLWSHGKDPSFRREPWKRKFPSNKCNLVGRCGVLQLAQQKCRPTGGL